MYCNQGLEPGPGGGATRGGGRQEGLGAEGGWGGGGEVGGLVGAGDNDDEMRILKEILVHAQSMVEGGGGGGGGGGGRGGLNLALVHVLKSYEVVLMREKRVPSEDTFFYRLLLQMSMDRRT